GRGRDERISRFAQCPTELRQRQHRPEHSPAGRKDWNVAAKDVLRGGRVLIARTQSLLKFFLLTFALAWGAWGVAIAIWSSAVSILRWPVFLVGVFAPAIAALASTARTDGRAGVSALLRRIGRCG